MSILIAFFHFIHDLHIENLCDSSPSFPWLVHNNDLFYIKNGKGLLHKKAILVLFMVIELRRNEVHVLHYFGLLKTRMWLC